MLEASTWLAVAAAVSGGLPRQALTYSAASVVNAASNLPGALAPNALLTIYGGELSFETAALQASQIEGGRLPLAPAGIWITVQFGALNGHVLYASPNQINVLAPASLRPGRTSLRVVRQGLAGPPVELEVKAAAPGLFLWNGWALSTRADGSVVEPQRPASPGEVVVLYATGLGQTDPKQEYGRLASGAAPVPPETGLEVILGGAPVDRKRILYAGATPGFAGLYQINLLLPEGVAPDPEVRVKVAGEESQSGVRLPIRVLAQP
jgi:uncharacterized protein (TIGR03437 family)